MTGRAVPALGVDIGGSHLLALSQDRSANVLCTATRPRDPAGGTQGLLRAIVDAVAEVRAKTPGSGRWPVGVAFPGAFETGTGRVLYSPNLPEWVGVSVEGQLRRALGADVVLENDANAAAWAEHRLGGHGRSDLLYVTLGTGVGGGLVLSDRLYPGPWGFSGEIGHVRVGGVTRRCGCGLRGCLETVAGGWGLAASCRTLAKQRPRSPLGLRVVRSGEASARELLLAAEEGDRDAARVRDEAGAACGEAIGAVVNVIGVPRVVLGGRLLHRAPGYYAAIREGVERALLPPLVHRVQVRRSPHWRVRGAQGALLLAAEAA